MEKKETDRNQTQREIEETENLPPLHRAARFGDIAEMEHLIAAGADINAHTNWTEVNRGDGLTPLMVAAMSLNGASAQTITWLLANGADLHAVSEKGFTAAWYAASRSELARFDWDKTPSDQAERLRLLLDAGLDAHEVHRERTLLTRACSTGDPKRVRLLLERGLSVQGASPQPKKYPSQVPLFCAAASDSAECVQLLLDAGADVRETILRNPDHEDFPGETALAQTGSADVARLLITAGANVQALDWYQDVLGSVLRTA